MSAIRMVLVGILIASFIGSASARFPRIVHVVCHDGVLDYTTGVGCDWDGTCDGVCTFAFFCSEFCAVPPPGCPTPGGQGRCGLGIGGPSRSRIRLPSR